MEQPPLPIKEALQGVAEVLAEVEAISDLECSRRSLPQPGCIGAAPIPRCNLHPGVVLEPVGQGGGFSIGEQIDDPMPFKVEQNGAVGVPLAISPVIDSEHPGGRSNWQWRGTEQAQQRRGARLHAQARYQTSTGGAPEREADGTEDRLQTQGTTSIGSHERGQ